MIRGCNYRNSVIHRTLRPVTTFVVLTYVINLFSFLSFWMPTTASATDEDTWKSNYASVMKVGASCFDSFSPSYQSSALSMTSETFGLFGTPSSKPKAFEIAEHFPLADTTSLYRRTQAILASELAYEQTRFAETFGRKLIPASSSPIATHAYQAAQTLRSWETSQKISYPTVISPEQVASEMAYVNQNLSKINQVCSSRHTTYTKLMNAYQNKSLQNSLVNPEITQLLHPERFSTAEILAMEKQHKEDQQNQVQQLQAFIKTYKPTAPSPGSLVGSVAPTPHLQVPADIQTQIRTRLQQERDQGAIESTFYSFLNETSSLSFLLTHKTSLSTSIGTLDPVACVEKGQQLKLIPNDHLIAVSILEQEQTFQKTMKEVVRDVPPFQATEQLQQLIQANPVPVRLALEVQPQVKDARHVCQMIQQIDQTTRNQEMASDIAMTVPGFEWFGAASNLMRVTGLIARSYMLLNSAAARQSAQNLIQKINQGMLAREIPSTQGQQTIDKIKEQRPTLLALAVQTALTVGGLSNVSRMIRYESQLQNLGRFEGGGTQVIENPSTQLTSQEILDPSKNITLWNKDGTGTLQQSNEGTVPSGNAGTGTQPQGPKGAGGGGLGTLERVTPKTQLGSKLEVTSEGKLVAPTKNLTLQNRAQLPILGEAQVQNPILHSFLQFIGATKKEKVILPSKIFVNDPLSEGEEQKYQKQLDDWRDDKRMQEDEYNRASNAIHGSIAIEDVNALNRVLELCKTLAGWEKNQNLCDWVEKKINSAVGTQSLDQFQKKFMGRFKIDFSDTKTKIPGVKMGRDYPSLIQSYVLHRAEGNQSSYTTDAINKYSLQNDDLTRIISIVDMHLHLRGYNPGEITRRNRQKFLIDLQSIIAQEFASNIRAAKPSEDRDESSLHFASNIAAFGIDQKEENFSLLWTVVASRYGIQVGVMNYKNQQGIGYDPETKLLINVDKNNATPLLEFITSKSKTETWSYPNVKYYYEPDQNLFTRSSENSVIPVFKEFSIQKPQLIFSHSKPQKKDNSSNQSPIKSLWEDIVHDFQNPSATLHHWVNEIDVDEDDETREPSSTKDAYEALQQNNHFIDRMRLNEAGEQKKLCELAFGKHDMETILAAKLILEEYNADHQDMPIDCSSYVPTTDLEDLLDLEIDQLYLSDLPDSQNIDRFVQEKKIKTIRDLVAFKIIPARNGQMSMLQRGQEKGVPLLTRSIRQLIRTLIRVDHRLHFGMLNNVKPRSGTKTIRVELPNTDIFGWPYTGKKFIQAPIDSAKGFGGQIVFLNKLNTTGISLDHPLMSPWDLHPQTDADILTNQMIPMYLLPPAQYTSGDDVEQKERAQDQLTIKDRLQMTLDMIQRGTLDVTLKDVLCYLRDHGSTDIKDQITTKYKDLECPNTTGQYDYRLIGFNNRYSIDERSSDPWKFAEQLFKSLTRDTFTTDREKKAYDILKASFLTYKGQIGLTLEEMKDNSLKGAALDQATVDNNALIVSLKNSPTMLGFLARVVLANRYSPPFMRAPDGGTRYTTTLSELNRNKLIEFSFFDDILSHAIIQWQFESILKTLGFSNGNGHKHVVMNIPYIHGSRDRTGQHSWNYSDIVTAVSTLYRGVVAEDLSNIYNAYIDIFSSDFLEKIPYTDKQFYKPRIAKNILDDQNTFLIYQKTIPVLIQSDDHFKYPATVMEVVDYIHEYFRIAKLHGLKPSTIEVKPAYVALVEIDGSIQTWIKSILADAKMRKIWTDFVEEAVSDIGYGRFHALLRDLYRVHVTGHSATFDQDGKQIEPADFNKIKALGELKVRIVDLLDELYPPLTKDENELKELAREHHDIADDWVRTLADTGILGQQQRQDGSNPSIVGNLLDTIANPFTDIYHQIANRFWAKKNEAMRAEGRPFMQYFYGHGKDVAYYYPKIDEISPYFKFISNGFENATGYANVKHDFTYRRHRTIHQIKDGLALIDVANDETFGSVSGSPVMRWVSLSNLWIIYRYIVWPTNTEISKEKQAFRTLYDINEQDLKGEMVRLEDGRVGRIVKIDRFGYLHALINNVETILYNDEVAQAELVKINDAKMYFAGLIGTKQHIWLDVKYNLIEAFSTGYQHAMDILYRAHISGNDSAYAKSRALGTARLNLIGMRYTPTIAAEIIDKLAKAHILGEDDHRPNTTHLRFKITDPHTWTFLNEIYPKLPKLYASLHMTDSDLSIGIRYARELISEKLKSFGIYRRDQPVTSFKRRDNAYYLAYPTEDFSNYKIGVLSQVDDLNQTITVVNITSGQPEILQRGVLEYAILLKASMTQDLKMSQGSQEETTSTNEIKATQEFVVKDFTDVLKRSDNAEISKLMEPNYEVPDWGKMSYSGNYKPEHFHFLRAYNLSKSVGVIFSVGADPTHYIALGYTEMGGIVAGYKIGENLLLKIFSFDELTNANTIGEIATYRKAKTERPVINSMALIRKFEAFNVNTWNPIDEAGINLKYKNTPYSTVRNRERHLVFRALIEGGLKNFAKYITPQLIQQFQRPKGDYVIAYIDPTTLAVSHALLDTSVYQAKKDRIEVTRISDHKTIFLTQTEIEYVLLLNYYETSAQLKEFDRAIGSQVQASLSKDGQIRKVKMDLALKTTKTKKYIDTLIELGSRTPLHVPIQFYDPQMFYSLYEENYNDDPTGAKFLTQSTSTGFIKKIVPAMGTIVIEYASGPLANQQTSDRSVYVHYVNPDQFQIFDNIVLNQLIGP